MKALASSSSRVVLEIHREAGLVKRVKEASCFFRAHKKNGDFRFLNFVAFLQQRRPIKPLVCLSSKTQAELESPDAQVQDSYPIKTMHLKFQLHKECSFGQQFLIVGDDPILGSWNPEKAVPMDWSDGNHIPVGKAVQFKFVLSGDGGNILLWQPGPDRVFQTWETENKIIVSEDWGDVELQKIMEEAQSHQQFDDSNIKSDVPIPEADNLSFSEEEPEFNIKLESVSVDTYTDPAQLPLPESCEEQTVAVSASEKMQKIAVAKTVTSKKPKKMMKPNEQQTDARTSAPSEDYTAIPNEMMVAQNIYGSNGRATKARKNLASAENEGSLMNYEEEGPVLVPGLSTPAVPTEEPTKEKIEKSTIIESLDENYESTDLNMPEPEEKQEPYSEPSQAEIEDTLSDNVEKIDEELKQKPQSAERENSFQPGLPNDSPQAETSEMFYDSEVSFEDELEQQKAETAEQSASQKIHDVWNNDTQWGSQTAAEISGLHFAVV